VDIFKTAPVPVHVVPSTMGKKKSSGNFIIRKTSQLLGSIILFINKHRVLITVVGHMEQAMKIFYEVVSSIT
jgi:hypothetical protein